MAERSRAASAHSRDAILFGFMGVAHGVVAFAIFPQLYHSVRQLYWHLRRVYGQHVSVLDSPLERSLLVPEFDVLALAVLLFLLWASYYFFIACLHVYSDQAYGPFSLLFDLCVAVTLFFAANSIGHIESKPFHDTESAWIALFAVSIMSYVRVLVSASRLRPPTSVLHGESIQTWTRFLVPAGHCAAVAASLFWFGVVFGASDVDPLLALEGMLSASLVYIGLLSVLGACVALLRRREDEQLGRYWRQAWKREKLRACIGILLALGVGVTVPARYDQLSLAILSVGRTWPCGLVALIAISCWISLTFGMEMYSEMSSAVRRVEDIIFYIADVAKSSYDERVLVAYVSFGEMSGPDSVRLEVVASTDSDVRTQESLGPISSILSAVSLVEDEWLSAVQSRGVRASRAVLGLESDDGDASDEDSTLVVGAEEIGVEVGAGTNPFIAAFTRQPDPRNVNGSRLSGAVVVVSVDGATQFIVGKERIAVIDAASEISEWIYRGELWAL